MPNNNDASNAGLTATTPDIDFILTTTTACRNIRLSEGERKDVDATVKKLVDKLQELELQKHRLNLDIDSIKRALSMLGIEPPSMQAGVRELQYVMRQAFRDVRLTDACLTILQDAEGEWMTKAQVEYLLVRGGYRSTAKDWKNSVDITLRNLADKNLIEANRAMGRNGNKYRFSKGNSDDVTNTRATS